jgi:hypothetical protein
MGLKPLGSCLILCVLLAGCTNQSSLPISITITPGTTAVASGQTIQMSATITNNTPGLVSATTINASSTTISWAATAGSIDANGNYTAPSVRQSTSAL